MPATVYLGDTAGVESGRPLGGEQLDLLYSEQCSSCGEMWEVRGTFSIPGRASDFE